MSERPEANTELVMFVLFAGAVIALVGAVISVATGDGSNAIGLSLFTLALGAAFVERLRVWTPERERSADRPQPERTGDVPLFAVLAVLGVMRLTGSIRNIGEWTFLFDVLFLLLCLGLLVAALRPDPTQGES